MTTAPYKCAHCGTPKRTLERCVSCGSPHVEKPKAQADMISERDAIKVVYGLMCRNPVGIGKVRLG